MNYTFYKNVYDILNILIDIEKRFQSEGIFMFNNLQFSIINFLFNNKISWIKRLRLNMKVYVLKFE